MVIGRVGDAPAAQQLPGADVRELGAGVKPDPVVLLHDDARNRAQSQLDREGEPHRAGARDEHVRYTISHAPSVTPHRASGSGRSWNLTTLGRFSVPPSTWNTVRVE